MSDDEDVRFSFEVAEMLGEMADRLSAMHKITPGAVAKTTLRVDDVEYELTLKVKA